MSSFHYLTSINSIDTPRNVSTHFLNPLTITGLSDLSPGPHDPAPWRSRRGRRISANLAQRVGRGWPGALGGVPGAAAGCRGVPPVPASRGACPHRFQRRRLCQSRSLAVLPVRLGSSWRLRLGSSWRLRLADYSAGTAAGTHVCEAVSRAGVPTGRLQAVTFKLLKILHLDAGNNDYDVVILISEGRTK